MTNTAGYLVIYSQNQKPVATLYDEFLNYVDETEPDSDRVQELLTHAKSEENLQDIMWSEVLGELSDEERAQAKAYKLGP